jgi:TonB-linked SusC/RagA family outer membrane protein
MHYKKKIIFMIIALLTINSAIFSQNISLNMKDVTVKQAMSELKNKTGYSFVYSVGDLDTQRSISVSVQNEKVNEAVKQILAGQDLSYQIEGKNIIVKKNQNSSAEGKKSKKVSGTVVDEAGDPIVGANVLIKGTSEGVVTDFDGNFSLEVPEGAVLVISYIGFESQTVVVNGKSSYKVKLVPNIKSLEEVVLTGYTSQKKKNITGSVANLKVSEDMRLMVTSAAGNLLTGRIAGVNVSTPSGLPGSSPSISIRTNSSWNSQNVLYVIDGVVRSSGDFNNLSPNEIQDISVLKDAAAAAIYGARSAGGVILVTTRRGEIGKMKIDYSYSYGQDERQNVPRLTSAVQLAEISNRMNAPTSSNYFSPAEIAVYESINNGWGYDQLETIWQNPNVKTQNFSVSGGNENFKYFAGLSNVNQETFVPGYGYDKTNFRFNTTVNMSKNLQFFAGMGLSNRDQASDRFEGPNSLYRKLLVWQPWQPIYTKGGQYIDYGWIANMGAEANKESGYNKTNTFKPDVNLSLTYKIPFVQGLTAKASYAASWTNSHYTEFGKYYSMAVMKQSSNGHIISTDDADITGWKKNYMSNQYLYKKATWSNDKQLSLQLDYNHTFGKHDFQGALGYEAYENIGASVYGGREKNPVYLTDQFWAFSSARADDWAGGDTELENGRKSVWGKAYYNYDNKYLFSASFREDGSMNFASDNRWGFFPGASAAWVISEENFFNKEIVNFLKLRASVALTGNDAVGGWQWQESYSQGSTAYFGTTPAPSVGVKYGNIVNPDITWEKTQSYNFAVEMNFLKHWDTTFEYYVQDTYDILGARTASVPTSFSGNLPAENYGEVKAQGVEFSLGYRNNVGAFNYYVNANASYGWNEVLTQDYATNAQPIDIPVGKSRNRIIGYQIDQLIRTQADLDAFNAAHPGYKMNGLSPALGQLVYKDITGPNGVPDNLINSWDRIEISKNNNSVNFGLNLGGNYKGFNFDMVFAGSLGSVKSYREIADGVEWNRMHASWHDNSWTPVNSNADLPQRIRSGQAQTYNTDSNFWYKNNNFIRLQNLNFGYNFKTLSKLKEINNLKLFVTGSNLFTIDNFKLWDPQGSMTGYPIVRTLSVGLNVGF